MSDTSITFRCSEDLKMKLDRIAYDEVRTLSSMVRILLTEAIEARAKSSRKK